MKLTCFYKLLGINLRSFPIFPLFLFLLRISPANNPAIKVRVIEKFSTL